MQLKLNWACYLFCRCLKKASKRIQGRDLKYRGNNKPKAKGDERGRGKIVDMTCGLGEVAPPVKVFQDSSTNSCSRSVTSHLAPSTELLDLKILAVSMMGRA